MILHTDIPTRPQVDRLLRDPDPTSVSIYLPTDPASSGEAAANQRRRRPKLTERVDGHLRILEDPPLRVRLHTDEPALADEVFEAYRASLPEYRRHLLDRFSFVDAARQVVGVGSVGMRVFLVLLEGRDGADPLFLQIKQAESSVYEAYRGPSRRPNHGERVVVGERLIQSATTSSPASPRSPATTSTCGSSAT